MNIRRTDSNKNFAYQADFLTRMINDQCINHDDQYDGLRNKNRVKPADILSETRSGSPMIISRNTLLQKTNILSKMVCGSAMKFSKTDPSKNSA